MIDSPEQRLEPLRFSRLQQAELVIWVDRGFESGFARVPEILVDSMQYDIELKDSLFTLSNLRNPRE